MRSANQLAGIAPLRRRSLRDTVASRIRSSIVSGDLAPGEEFSAPTLGQQFGVSATPVREAMLDLVREGLVEVLPNRGFRVTEVSDKVLADITSVRLLLEPPAVASITESIPVADLPVVRARAEAIVQAAADRDLTAYLEADAVFHLGLLGYTGNDTLIDVVSRLRAQTRQFGLKALLEAGELPANAREHIAIAERIDARDPDGVERLLQIHIRHTIGIWAGHSEPPIDLEKQVEVDEH